MNAREVLIDALTELEVRWTGPTPQAGPVLVNAEAVIDHLLAALSDAGYLVVRITPETREEMVAAGARALALPETFHARQSQYFGDDYWSHTLDANSRAKAAALVLDRALAVLTAEGEA